MLRVTLPLVLLCRAAFGQSSSFEVASIKPAAPATGHQQYHMTVAGDQGRIEFVNASLLDLVRTAYRVRAYQVKGPEWMATQKFDLIAKLAEGTTRDQAPEMLQALLADRFKLAVHRSKDVFPGVAMVVAKGGTKLTVSTAESAKSGWSRSFMPDGSMHVEAKKMTMPALADLIAGFLGYPVVDTTDEAGEYDVSLDFSPEDLSTGSKSAGVIASGADDRQTGSSIPASLQRAGLKLESRKLPLDVIVVDRLERVPTAN
jgi:uncharacterized protein (TIGR03435 family)